MGEILARTTGMYVTSLSLLQRLQAAADPDAWKRLVALYEPLIHKWLRCAQAPASDAEDLSQEVLAVVVRELPRFAHNGQTGAFRSWLRHITVNRLRAFWRAGRGRPQATGDSGFLELAQQLEDPASELSRTWDREHDEHVLARLLEAIAPEFEATTVAAFRRVALEGRPVEETAAALGISTAAVYIAKSRVLRRLRQEAAGLLD